MLVIVTTLVALRLTAVGVIPRQTPRLCLAAIARESLGAGLTCVITREEICNIARSTLVVLRAVCLCDELSAGAFSFVRFARRACALCAALRVVTISAIRALGSTRDAVLRAGTALVAFSLAAGREVSALTDRLCA